MFIRRLLDASLGTGPVHGGVLGLRRALRFPMLTVITYHRVHDRQARTTGDPDVIDATPADFEQQLVFVSRHFSPIGLADLRAYFRGGSLPPNPLLITFDDGYRSCWDVARPILVRVGVPAAFFIATDYVTRRRVFWWDGLTHLLAHAQRRRFAVETPRRLDVDLADRESAKRLLLRLIKDTPCLDIDAFLRRLAVAADVPWDDAVERTLADELVMTWDDIRGLRMTGMEIGSHTRTHRPLDTMSPAELSSELAGSRADLERELGDAVQAFSYPVRGPLVRQPLLRAAIGAAGYDLAFSYGTGAQPLWGDVDPLSIRRIAIDRAVTGPAFSALLTLPLRTFVGSPRDLRHPARREAAPALARAPRARCAPARPGVRLPAVVLGDLSLVRPLGAGGVPVILVTSDGGDPALTSRLVSERVVIPELAAADRTLASAALAAAGADLRRRWGRPLPLFYGSDRHLQVLYGAPADLSESLLYTTNEATLAAALLDKGRFHELCVRAGLPVPPTVVPSTEPLDEAVAALREPLVVKPRCKSTAPGVLDALSLSLKQPKGKAVVFERRADLLASDDVWRLRGQLVIQELIATAPADLPSFHGYVSAGGELLAWFTGLKVRTYPRFGGDSAFIELTRDPAVEALGREVVAKLGIRGPFKIDLIRSATTGALLVMEVNARFTLWGHLGAAHGVNLPLVAYEDLVDGRAPDAPPTYQPRWRWANLYRDYHAFREEASAGSLTAARWVRSHLEGPTLYEAFAWDDPLPFLLWAGGMARAAVR
jgi:predicted ATP-grasp superfamily ATP-dependent carboligase/peptidoglycan/xylan/chitin deacetylase (PgdA/CDA1 family)